MDTLTLMIFLSMVSSSNAHREVFAQSHAKIEIVAEKPCGNPDDKLIHPVPLPPAGYVFTASLAVLSVAARRKYLPAI